MSALAEREAAALTEVDAILGGLDVQLRHLADERLENPGKTEDFTPEQDRPAAIVVVGEPSVGKSSLVNALLGRELMASANEVSTATYVTFASGPQATATAHFDARTEAISLEQVRDYSSLAGATTADWVEVVLPEPRLEGVVLIDTPGVGGLGEQYGQLTLRALHEASALLFLTEAGRPMSQSELDFLQQASRRIDRVILVLTKVDHEEDEGGDWHERVRENRAALAARAPRFQDAPYVGTCAHRAAAEEIDAPADDSGVAELWHEIGAIATAQGLLRQANRARSARVTTEAALGVCLEREAMSADTEALQAAYESEAEALKVWLEQDFAQWRYELDDRMDLIGRDLSSLVRRGCRQLLADVTSTRQVNPKADSQQLQAVLATGVGALHDDAAAQLREHVERLIAEMAGRLPRRSDALAGRLQQIAGPHLADVDLAGYTASELERNDILTIQSTYMGFNMTKTLLGMVGSVAALGPVFGAVSLPFALVGAALWTGKARRQHTQVAQRADFRAWAAIQLDDVGEALRQQLSDRLKYINRTMVTEFGKAMEEQRRAYESNVERCRTELARDTEARRRELDDLRWTRRNLEGLLERIDHLLNGISTAVNENPS